MEIGQFVWSFARERWVTQRNTILNVKTEKFWKFFRTSHFDRVLCQSSNESRCKQERSQVKIGDPCQIRLKVKRPVMRIPSLRYDNSRRRKWSPRKCGKYIELKNSDLCSFSGMVKHVQRNMSREMEKYIAALFCYCYQLWLFQPPHSASITIKAATNVSDSE